MALALKTCCWRGKKPHAIHLLDSVSATTDADENAENI